MSYDEFLRSLKKYIEDYNESSLRKWVSLQDPMSSLYKDTPVSSGDFVDGNVNNCIEEKYASRLIHETAGPVYRTEFIRKDIVKYEWELLTENRRRWEVRHWLNTLEGYRVKYAEELASGDSRFWYMKDWYNDTLIDHLEWLCYLLDNQIDNWRLAYLIEYGIKSIDDKMIGPFNVHSNPETVSESSPNYKSKGGVNVTLHIVDYYSGESDCYSGNDIYMRIYIGSSSWTFTGPEDEDSWSGDATFTAYVTANTVQITVHVYEDDSGACGGDDDYGSFTITYNTVTKTWSGDTSSPYAETSGDDGWADVWFFVESDSDNNPRTVARGSDGAGYLITEYNGKTNYNDPQDTWEFEITQDDISTKQTIVFQMTPNQNADYDVYLYDPNGKLLTSAAHVGDGVIESVVYRLSLSDTTGTYSVVIKRVAGYGPYTFHFDVRDMHTISVSVTGLGSESTTVIYYKFGSERTIPLNSDHPFFEDLCDNQTTVSIGVPDGLYTYDNTSYYITRDTSIVVHFYRTPLKIVINEVSSVGSGSDEWIELYNAGTENVYLNGWILTDQDGNTYTIPDDLYYMPPGKFLIIYSGNGDNQYDFSTGYAILHTGIENMWNDDGDDVLLIYNGHYIDYMAYSRGSGDLDVDSPPSGINFTLDGSGAWGCAPAPYLGGSISLVPNGVDNDRASDWYVSNGSSATPGTSNSPLLYAVGYSRSPANVSVGARNVYLLKIKLGAIGDTVGVTNLSIELKGNATDSDITHIKLFEDENGNGEYNVGDNLVRNTTFYGGRAIFSNLGLTVDPGKEIYLFVLADITTSYLAYHHIFSVSISSSDLVPTDASTIVFTHGDVSSNATEILPVDQAPPNVVSSSVTPSIIIGGKMYVRENFTIDLLFNKDMLTNIDPGVSITSANVTKSAGYWLNSRTWRQEFVIYGKYDGEILITIAGARDTAGNRMESYSIALHVDTVPPKVLYRTNISGLVSSDFSMSFHFSEYMDTSLFPSISIDPSIITVTSRVWTTPSDLKLAFSVNMNVEGKVEIQLYGSKDVVGNSMRPYYFTVDVDTKKPAVESLVISPNITMDGKLYVRDDFDISVTYNEAMNTSIYPGVAFGDQSAFSIKSINWLDNKTALIRMSLSASISERVELTIMGAKDIAGNIQENYSFYIYADNIAPTAIISLDDKEPFGPGTVNITIQFSEEVDKNSTIFICRNSTWNHTIEGIWLSSTLWRGTVDVDYSWSSGVYEIYAVFSDTVGNTNSTSKNFTVDTDSPVAIFLEPTMKIVGHNVVNITISFSEDISPDTIHVDFGGYPVVGHWINSTLWTGRYDIKDEYGPVNITVYGAKDLAGNEMKPISKTIIVDTKGPKVSDVIYPLKVDEGEKIKITATIVDEYSNVTSAMLYYRTQDTDTYTALNMKKEGDKWVAYIPGDDVIPSKLEFYIVSYDTFGNSAESRGFEIFVTPWYLVNWWIWVLLMFLLVGIVALLIRRKMLHEKAKEIPIRGVKPKVIYRSEEVDVGDEYEDFYE